MSRAFVVAATALALAAPASGATAKVAALQVGLRAHGLYAGSVDGVVGPATRAALGPYGEGTLGRRPLAVGAIGWDVAELQFELAWHGFPSGPFDGRFGRRTVGALRRFQRFAGLRPDGVAGAA